MAPPPSTMPWLMDPQLYLRSEADGVVHVWRCKKTSSVLVPMKANDFDDLGEVTNHQDLVQHLIKWDETKYRSLIKYISARRLLVNREGLVIVELYQFGEDGKVDSNADTIYIRSHDIMQLDTYVSCFKMQTVPFRPMQYLEADPAVEVIGSSVSCPNEEALKDEVKRLTAALLVKTNELADLKSRNSTLESNLAKANTELNIQTNKVGDLESTVTILEDELTKTTTDLAARTKEVVDLESEKQILEGKMVTLSTDLTSQTDKVATLREELIQVKSTLEKKVDELVMNNEALEEKVKNFTAEVINNSRPDWMIADHPNNLVGIEELRDYTDHGPSQVTFVGLPGVYEMDDGTTNVKASYLVRVFVKGDTGTFGATGTYKGVALEDLVLHKEKARFSYSHWVLVNFGRTKFIYRGYV